MYDEYQIRRQAKNDSNLDPGHWLGLLVVIVVLCLFCARACAQTTKARIDTMYCDNSCIEKFVSTRTENGKTKFFVVYNDKKQNVSDLIPVPLNVMTYIDICRQNGITPSLAIKLRNGIIISLMRYKPKYVRK